MVCLALPRRARGTSPRPWHAPRLIGRQDLGPLGVVAAAGCGWQAVVGPGLPCRGRPPAGGLIDRSTHHGGAGAPSPAIDAMLPTRRRSQPHPPPTTHPPQVSQSLPAAAGPMAAPADDLDDVLDGLEAQLAVEQQEQHEPMDLEQPLQQEQ